MLNVNLFTRNFSSFLLTCTCRRKQFGCIEGFFCVWFPDLGEKNKRQHKDEDLPGAAAEGSVCHSSAVGCVKHYHTQSHLCVYPSIQPVAHSSSFGVEHVASRSYFIILYTLPPKTQIYTDKVFCGYEYLVQFFPLINQMLLQWTWPDIQLFSSLIFVTMWHACKTGLWSQRWLVLITNLSKAILFTFIIKLLSSSQTAWFE